MDDATKTLVSKIKAKGVPVTVIANATGITNKTLYPSFSGRRKLRADEFLLICKFMEFEPKEFTPNKIQEV